MSEMVFPGRRNYTSRPDSVPAKSNISTCCTSPAFEYMSLLEIFLLISDSTKRFVVGRCGCAPVRRLPEADIVEGIALTLNVLCGCRKAIDRKLRKKRDVNLCNYSFRIGLRAR